MSKPKMGRMGYLNSLPIYHALEAGIIPHNYELVSGPPALLNTLMEQGQLAVGATSSIEYARRAERYLLLPDLAIGSDGPVQSVLLLSSRPVEELHNTTILVSAETHTSALLLRILLQKCYHIPVQYTSGLARDYLPNQEMPTNPETTPQAMLVIGDEALRLRHHPFYSFQLDLGEAWKQWTGLPFVFGLWVLDRRYIGSLPHNPAELLRQSLDWGTTHREQILDVAQQHLPIMSRQALDIYFNTLSYKLGEWEQGGLHVFFEHLAKAGYIPAPPPLQFI